MDQFYTMKRISVGFDDFKQLPSPVCYKKEFIDGAMILTPRTKAVRLTYRLEKNGYERDLADDLTLRNLGEDDWDEFENLMRNSFSLIDPFYSLRSEERHDAIAKCVDNTRSGKDGKLMLPYSYIITDAGKPIGALVTTCYEGSPHLTWIMVNQPKQRRGIGTFLLQTLVKDLQPEWQVLDSTVLMDNVGALIWHWTMGFKIKKIYGYV